MVKRFDQFLDEALVDSWPVFVAAEDYDALAAENADMRVRLAEAMRLLAREGIHMDDHGCWCAQTTELEKLQHESEDLGLYMNKRLNT